VVKKDERHRSFLQNNKRIPIFEMMKPAAYILIVLMLFFMLQPVLIQCQVYALAECAPPKTGCGGNSCSSKAAVPKKETKDCERTAPCNPFASCSQCHYVAASRIIYAATAAQMTNRLNSHQGDNITSGFLNDCWHPPELVHV
jgi:hypothetical protein